MRKITSKNVLAIGITPRIDEYARDVIQEFLDGTHPMSPKRKVYDTGTKKKTVLDQSPVGPNEIADEPGDRTSHDNVGSGYKEDPDPGGRPDDETGPGNARNIDHEQDFATPDNGELIFRQEDDSSSKFSPLNYESQARDYNATNHLRRLQSRPKTIDELPKRRPVDQNSRSWRHSYV